MTRTRGVAALLLLALVPLVAACGVENLGPHAVLRPEPVWPPPGVVDLEEPEAPEVLDPGATRVDATRYVTYLYDEIEWMLTTSFNAKVLRNHECTVCTDLVALADRARTEHLVLEFGPWVPVIANMRPRKPVTEGDTSRYWEFLIRLDQPEIRVLDVSGNEVDVVPARSTVTDLLVAENGGRWWLLNWFDVSAGSA